MCVEIASENSIARGTREVVVELLECGAGKIGPQNGVHERIAAGDADGCQVVDQGIGIVDSSAQERIARRTVTAKRPPNARTRESGQRRQRQVCIRHFIDEIFAGDQCFENRSCREPELFDASTRQRCDRSRQDRLKLAQGQHVPKPQTDFDVVAAEPK